MADSFDHKIVALSAELMEVNAECRARNPQYRGMGYCSANRKCQGTPTHRCTYRYVTGRAGRVTTNKRELCQEHTEAFAKKHGVALPEAQSANAVAS